MGVGVEEGGEDDVGALSVQSGHVDGADGGVVRAEVQGEEDEEGHPCCCGGCDVGDDQGSNLLSSA